MDDVAHVHSGETTAIIKTDGTLWVWDSNSDGAVGNGGAINYNAGITGLHLTCPVKIMDGAALTQPEIKPSPAAPEQSSTPASSAKFTDVSASSPFAEAINWAVEKNITTGKTDTTFAPGEECANGQIVTFLYRAMGK